MAALATEVPQMDQQVDLSTIPIDQNGKEDSTDIKDDKPVTVFHDKDNFTVKHPLQNKWTLWFTKPPTGKVRQTLAPTNTDMCSHWWFRAITGMIS